MNHKFTQDELLLIKECLEASTIMGKNSHLVSDTLKKIDSKLLTAGITGNELKQLLKD